jgi:hypothetical protein
MTSSRPLSAALSSPPVVAVGGRQSPSFAAVDPNNIKKFSPPSSGPPSQNASPLLAAAAHGGKARRKKIKRIVELDGDGEHSDGSTSHTRTRSDGSSRPRTVKEDPSPARQESGLHVGTTTVLPTVKSEEPSPPPSITFRPAARSRHTRHHTEFLHIPNPTPEPTTSSLRKDSRNGSATLSSKSKTRRRLNASLYEPPTSVEVAGGPGDQIREADEYRKRIEALRSDMGEGWLKVFSQSQMGSTGVASG